MVAKVVAKVFWVVVQWLLGCSGWLLGALFLASYLCDLLVCRCDSGSSFNVHL